jgi:uncharacterized Zn-finger protein
MSNLNNYHNEIDNATNFLNQIIFGIVEKSKATLNCLQYNNVIIDDALPIEPSPPKSTFAKSKERKHECSTCKKSFFSRRCLVAHLKSHQEDRPFKCDLCNASFKFKNSLKGHMLKHSTDKPFKCGECGACFKYMKGLNNHSTLHSGEKPFECEYCHMKFFLKETLRAHMVIHSNPNRFKCPYENCGKMFNFKTHLQSHVKVHTGNLKPFSSFFIEPYFELIYLVKF